MASILNITRYIIKNEKLAPWVKFIWRFDAPEAGQRYKILPTDCIDVILNPGGGMLYEHGPEIAEAPLFHINGLRSSHSFVRHKWPGPVWGISFYAYGFFPLVNKAIPGLDKGVLDLYEAAPFLAEQLAGIACDNNFADQAHFTKVFRRYSGTSPYRFAEEKASVKENARYTYI